MSRYLAAHIFYIYLFSLKTIGRLKYTGTATPFCLPGIHLGILLITLIASLSQLGLIPLITSMLDISPVLLTTNRILTRPSVPFS